MCINGNVELSETNVLLLLQCISVHIGSSVVPMFAVYRWFVAPESC